MIQLFKNSFSCVIFFCIILSVFCDSNSHLNTSNTGNPNGTLLQPKPNSLNSTTTTTTNTTGNKNETDGINPDNRINLDTHFAYSVAANKEGGLSLSKSNSYVEQIGLRKKDQSYQPLSDRVGNTAQSISTGFEAPKTKTKSHSSSNLESVNGGAEAYKDPSEYGWKDTYGINIHKEIPLFDGTVILSNFPEKLNNSKNPKIDNPTNPSPKIKDTIMFNE